jgi:hypothetical protein
MNGTSTREESRHGALSPQTKHAPIPALANTAAVEDQVRLLKFFTKLTCVFSIRMPLLVVEQCRFLHY